MRSRMVMAVAAACLAVVAGGLAPARAAGDSPPAGPAGSKAARPPANPPVPWRDRLFFGGGIGLGFGDVDFVSVEPLIGVRLHPKVAVGTSFLYRWIDDSRYDESVSTSDYGARAFVQFFATPVIFLQTEYEYLNYEYVLSDFSTARSTSSSALAGAGVSQPMGGKASFFASALYNFSYDSQDPLSPYSSPWEYRVGVAVGF